MNGLRYIREKAGLSGAALARKLTVSQPTVFEWEHGKRKIPAKQLERLVQMFDIPSKYFDEISENEKEEIDIFIEIAKQREFERFEDSELTQANKNLKDALQRISKITKQKANSFDMFSDYISSISSYSKTCNLFADVLKLYGTDSIVRDCFTALIQAKECENNSDSELTKIIRQELFDKEAKKDEMKRLSAELDELY